MRTTLRLDDDVHSAVTRMAHQEGTSTGRVVSRLLRRTLGVPQYLAEPMSRHAIFRPFAARAGVVTTNEEVDALRNAGDV